MKKFLFLFLFIFCFSSVFALSFDLAKGNYSKGEFIDFNGLALGEVSVVLTASPGNKEIDSFVVKPDENGVFSLKYFISCVDPAGDWKMVVSDAEEESEKAFYVGSSVECEYFRVDFISPSSSSFFRKDKFDVRVKVTDAGKEVNNAEVYFWDFEGNKKRMNFEANGIYYFENVLIPVDSELKKTNFMVVALSGGKEKYGGSNIVSFEIRRVPIKIELIEPLVKEFNFGKPLELKVKPLYSADESIVSDVKIWVEFNNEKFNLVKEQEGIYSLTVPTEDLNSEIFYVNVFAEDSFGNSGTLSLDFEPKGYLYFYIAQNAIVYIFPALFVIYIVFVSFKQGRVFVNRLFLKRKRKKLLILMKKLQDDYFNKQIISREVYAEQYDNYNNELDKLESEMAELEKKQELS